MAEANLGIGDFRPLDLLAGEYLTFELGGESYGIEILKVQEIIGMMQVTRVPNAPDSIRGVVNLRGKVVTVVDLRLRFGLEKTPDTERTCIIVVQMTFEGVENSVGVIVDEVSEVHNVDKNMIEPPPSFGDNVDSAYIKAMGKVDEKVFVLLDIDQVLTSETFGKGTRTERPGEGN